MNIMEGFLLVPPERGSLIGRAAWKPRYVVLGSHPEPNLQNSITSLSERSSRSRIHLKSSSKSDLTDISETSDDPTQVYLSIFKAKGEWEYLAHHPISAIQFCEVRSIQHRKQSPPLPTLVVEFKNDSSASRLRKRRSSKAGLTLKDGYTNALLFRSVESERYSIYDWVIQMKLLLTAPTSLGDSAFSSLVNLTNPFVSRSNSASAQKTESQSRALHYINTSSSHTSLGKYSEVISPSPSLRSRRSDLSSKASSLAQGSGITSPLAFASGLSSDHPSPSSTSGNDYQLIEGWTSAQGRTSVLSSHTRGNNSNASGITTSSANRETILDRAFQMRCIPGSERVSAQEDIDKLSSTARFEALMREKDERRLAKRDLKPMEDSIDEGLEKLSIADTSDDHQDDLYSTGQENDLPAPAQRALYFISGRHAPDKQPLSPKSQNQVPVLNTQTLSTLMVDEAYGEEHVCKIPRAETCPCHNSTRSPTLTIPLRSYSSMTIPMKKENGNNYACNKLDAMEKRLSSTSVKRLSFQEFARRLSSTSSLLLVQTNQSSTSGKENVDYTNELTASSRSCPGKDERDHRCSWRSSVSAFGVEGTLV